MKKLLRNTLMVFGILLVAAQFVRPEKNLGPAEPGSDDIMVAYNAPANIRQILQKACYDCHSDHTRYPWYSDVQPIGWWLADHIKDAKKELNFSTFVTYSSHTQNRKLDESIDEIDEGHMPLPSYTWIHRDAILSKAEKQALTDWFENLAEY